MSTVTSPFQKKPAYRYIRETDKLPTDIHYEALAEEIICKVKLFNPTGIGTWWIASYEPETGIAFGVAELYERELGSIWVPEIVEYRGRFGLPIERDLHYKPTSCAEILKAGRGY
jgi:hypothetical protein